MMVTFGEKVKVAFHTFRTKFIYFHPPLRNFSLSLPSFIGLLKRKNNHFYYIMSIEEKPTKESSTTGGSKTPEFEPPQACVSRIIKNVLPENIQITKDARAAFTRAAGIFIFYLTHCANDFSKEKKRQTIYTEDVLNALKELDFGEFQAPLEEFLKCTCN